MQDNNGSDAASAAPLTSRAWGVIPVYNNGGTVRDVALACRRELEHVVVVDDGSTDADVRQLLEGTDITVLSHARKQGKGQALKTALAHVLDHGGEFMITLDADGQHDPGDIPALLRVVEEDPAAVVIGARRMDAPNVPRSSRFGMRLSDFWLRLETGLDVRDSQSGFRAYPVRTVSRLALRGRAYDFEVEVLAKAAWAGLAIRSVDVNVVYAPKGARISHFRKFADNALITHRHGMLMSRRLLPWPHRRLVKRAESEFEQFIRHPFRFLGRLLVERATPVELGASAAVGIFLATLPLISLHTVAILYATSRLRLNRVLALAIQNLCAPPFVPFVCIEVGYFLYHGRWLKEFTAETLWHQAPSRLAEWVVGSLVVAPVLAVLAGVVVYGIARAARRPSNEGRKGGEK